MRASDLVEQIPTATRATTGAEAAQLVAEYRLTGLVVLGDDGRPCAVLPGSQVLHIMVPQYIRDDPRLAHALDDETVDELRDRLEHVTIGELLDHFQVLVVKPPQVLPEDTLIEIASAMATSHFPLVLVVDSDGTWHGTVMLSRVMAAIADGLGRSSDLVQHRLHHDVISRGHFFGRGPGDAAGQSE